MADGEDEDLTAADVDAAVDEGAAAIRARVALALTWLRNEWPAARIETFIRTDKVPEMLAELRPDIERAFRAIAAEVNDVYLEAGHDMEATVVEQYGGIAQWSPSQSTAAARMQENELKLVGEFTDEQLENIRKILVDQVVTAKNPRAAAVGIEDSLGLAPLHADWVSSYRELLENGDTKSLTAARARELASGRYDRTIQSAIEREQKLSADVIERMVDAYRQNAIAYRAEAIARTDGLRAVHQGHEDMLDSAIDRGELGEGDIEGIWHTKMDGRERDWHGSMNDQRRPYKTPFESGHGQLLRYPGDPDAPLDETCQCRCARGFRLKQHAAKAA
jgi:hypothetical protein